ncbi:holo-ACP synthase [Bifidobacterium sp. ESL0732]|uniref:holo-ACP synthase n=1 Tax=Bifidobacterium sp. ESL0732 TaxID=2983222 RepID=UPI0023F65002|nr:holo-ACP synthase [Bifidobacterium sp. ESL0732]WEV64958.1 holo-ACP synthase [Bifidobacterium sp. ESL0732]
MLGVGHDVVDVAAFAEQLDEPGSRGRRLFSVRELRQAAARAKIKHDDEATHLAAKWAGKEAVLKAWCEALGDRSNPYTLDDFPWSQIEILDDSRSRPHVVLTQAVQTKLLDSLAIMDSGVVSSNMTVSPRWHVSLSHDGPLAAAVVLLTGEYYRN